MERRLEMSRMEKIESRKEHKKEQKEQITTDFEILKLNKHRKRGEIKNRVTFSNCLHDQQDLCWENTSRDTSEEPQKPQKHQLKRDILSKDEGL